MSKLEEWNDLPEEAAIAPILACCGSQAFARAVVRSRPFSNVSLLSSAAERIWWSLGESDWMEALACHPRIGELPTKSAEQFSAWSNEEQSRARAADSAVLQAIAEKNREYEKRNGFLYIVCASGKSGAELLEILDRRLANSIEVEMREAAEQQRQITNIRLRKWFTQ
jgi:2-oxo-4-hydroxy-4-carboxy-5-ureidoimidazoline decarboxylase